MAKAPEVMIGPRRVAHDAQPLVIAEIGINHEGQFDRAVAMVDAAAAVGCECVKFQAHVVEDEMIPNDVIPDNATESIWDIMSRCALSEDEDRALKAYVEDTGMLYLSTPFSRAAADRLQRMDTPAYKIGSGECNNYPLVEHIASFGKPVILSTGMNTLASIEKSVQILRRRRVPFALLHCTSVYPTPYDKVRLGALTELKETFPDAVVGLSDHSLSNYPCLGAAALGASILERHFTADKSWPGPDIEVSMDPQDLKQLIEGSRAIHEASGGRKDVLPEEAGTIAFAFASVVSTRDIQPGEALTDQNVWVKRPGTGEILADDYPSVLGRLASRPIRQHEQLRWAWLQ